MNRVLITFVTSFILGVLSCFYVANFVDFGLWKTYEKVITNTGGNLDMTEFWEVYNIIEEDFFSSSEIEKKDLVDGAITWLVESLWDQHSEFMDPELTEKFNQALEWDFEWIGAVVEKTPIWVKVERILKWSPAKKYDVRNGDTIITANNQELQDLDIFDAVDIIKWPAGTSVNLKIMRPGEELLLDITVVREKIKIPSVEEQYFEEENIAYVAINMFWEQTASEFSAALENVSASWVEGLIIDVRDNGGWYLQSAVQILSEFIPEKEKLVQTRYRDSYFNQNYYSVNDGEIFDKKIVVLINGNSASASEITAWALREYDKAILIWEKSYGKWSVQQPFTMDDGSLLKLTVAKWFTPEGKNIEVDGISPDIEVKFLDEDYENSYDRQLEEAKILLQHFIDKPSIGTAIEEYEKQKLERDVIVVTWSWETLIIGTWWLLDGNSEEN